MRIGKRIADALDAQWIVVSVETPPMLRLSNELRDRRIDVLRLAESLGAETVTLDGTSAPRRFCNTRARATSPASWSANRSGAAGVRCFGHRPPGS